MSTFTFRSTRLVALISSFLSASAAWAQEPPRVCVDVSSAHPKTKNIVSSNELKESSVVLNQLRWPVGSDIRIKFLNGSESLQSKVRTYALEWTKHANLKFVFVNDGPADIRINFDDSGASWSRLGTSAKYADLDKQTMNFGWFNDQTPDAEIRRTTLHEFGHALALGHEHQQPSGSICWNRPKVYEYYAGPPNNWSRELVDTNIFQKYSSSITQYSEYDPNSIMHYPIDRSLLTCDAAVYLNAGLSNIDSDFISKIYPRRPWDPEPPTAEDEITDPEEKPVTEIEDVSETKTKTERDETDQETDPTVEDENYEDTDDIFDEIGSKEPTDDTATEDTEGAEDGNPSIEDDPEEVFEKEEEEENDKSDKKDFKKSKYSKVDLKDPEIFGEKLMRDMERGIIPEVPMTQNMEFIFQNQSPFISQSINFLGGVQKVSLVNQNKVGYFNTENLIYKIQYKKGFGLSSDLYVTRKRNGRLMAFYLSPPY